MIKNKQQNRAVIKYQRFPNGVKNGVKELKIKLRKKKKNQLLKIQEKLIQKDTFQNQQKRPSMVIFQESWEV